MSACLFSVYFCFHATVAELRIMTETSQTAKPKIFTIWPFTIILVTPVLQQGSPNFLIYNTGTIATRTTTKITELCEDQKG